MKLRDYLSSRKIRLEDFAVAIGASHAAVVSRYANGRRMPDRDAMAAIVKATAGAVQPNDFYDLPVTQPADETPTDQAEAA